MNPTQLTRLTQVLTELTGSEPVVRKSPGDTAAPGNLLWWAASPPASLYVGLSETDAELLQKMQTEAGPADASAGFADIMTRALGRGEIVAENPADNCRREEFSIEFPDGGKLHLTVAVPAAVAPEQTAPAQTSNLDMLMDIELPITLRFGRTQMALRDIAGLSFGSVIEFDRGVDEPVDILVNGHVVARGEAIMIKGSYGVRISEISSRREKFLATSLGAGQNHHENAGEQIG